MENTRKYTFGSVRWQEAMERNIAEKNEKGIPLKRFEQAFLEEQAEHNARMGAKA